jgi:hypothetical protein
MAQCITCGTELHPERAQKYNYCMAPACQEKNAQGLTMVAIGMNKAADELVILDDRIREALANGKYQDQRRGSFGPPAPSPAAARPTPAASSATGAATPDTAAATSGTPAATRGTTPAATPGTAAKSGTTAADAPARSAGRPARRRRPQPSRPASASATRPRWTASQERLALLYNQQGLRPDEIADKLGVSTYLATQIVLAARSHRKG